MLEKQQDVVYCMLKRNSLRISDLQYKYNSIYLKQTTKASSSFDSLSSSFDSLSSVRNAIPNLLLCSSLEVPKIFSASSCLSYKYSWKPLMSIYLYWNLHNTKIHKKKICISNVVNSQNNQSVGYIVLAIIGTFCPFACKNIVRFLMLGIRYLFYCFWCKLFRLLNAVT